MGKAVASVIVGVAVLVVCGVIDVRGADGPWRKGFAFVGPAPDWQDLIPFVVTDAEPEGRTPAFAKYHAMFIAFSDDDWESILAEGRVPRAGEREALAGVLCDADSFRVGDETYRVTGRIQRDVACFSTVFAIPYDEAAADAVLANESGRRGFHDRVARDRAAEGEFKLPEDVKPLLVHDAIPMQPGVPYAMLAGLGLTLYGASVLQWRLVVWLHAKAGMCAGIVAAQRAHPLIFRNVFYFNYALFILVMVDGLLMPLANLTASQWVFEMFSEGDLKELGAAYMDRNILLAAWETFRNNFIVQTFFMSALPSLFVPLWGVGKTLLSLTVVGFAMAPVWSGGAAPMTYHWLTVAIELQAYIMVSFAICVYTLHVWRMFVALLRKPEDAGQQARAEFRFGFEALVSATMYAFVALAIAAIYEAASLIVLSGGLAA